MWLINTTTLQLESFVSCPKGQYAILSHTWEEEELDFDTFKQGQGRNKKGFQKITYCCQQARSESLAYAWIDTCCIDKRSSTELSEAINSMYSWYAQSAICYAYLTDVSLSIPPEANLLEQSRWFTRGWTLQELLAPSKLNFYSDDWCLIGSRTALSAHILSATQIDKELLIGSNKITDYSVAQRMSWAAKRITTRSEDSAYCLLGIFNVNMPLMYGEGSKSFLRLQHAIIQQSDDESIFAWTGVELDGSGMLAKSPANFANAANIIQMTSGITTRPYSITNHGLEIELQLFPYQMNTYLAPLRCYDALQDLHHKQLAIFLCRTTSDRQYQRIVVDGIDLRSARHWSATKSCTRVLYVPENARLTLSPHGGLPIIQVHRTDKHELGFCDKGLSGVTAGNGTEEDVQLLNYCVSRAFTLSREPIRYDAQARLTAKGVLTENGFHLHCPQQLRHCNVVLSNFRDGIACCFCKDGVAGPVLEMRVGFNVDFEPVCILATRLGMERPSDLIYPRRRKSETLWSFKCTSFDEDLDYNKIVDSQVQQNLKNRSLLILRGDRVKGLIAINDLSSSSLGISDWYSRHTKLAVYMIPVSEVSENRQGLAWKVYVRFHKPYKSSNHVRGLYEICKFVMPWVVLLAISLVSIFFLCRTRSQLAINQFLLVAVLLIYFKELLKYT